MSTEFWLLWGRIAYQQADEAVQARDVSYGRANGLVSQLVSLGILDTVNRTGKYNRRFYAPRVIQAMLEG
jgi:hypothetical protein